MSYRPAGTMRTARTSGAFIAFLFLSAGGAGCTEEHPHCSDIALGTPLASLPEVLDGPASSIRYCSVVSGPVDETRLLDCCTREPASPLKDAGVRNYSGLGLVDCTKLEPFETWRVGLPYGDWTCPPEPDGHLGQPYTCFVWVRDGGVVGTCGGCEPD